MVILIVIRMLGTILERRREDLEIGGQIDTIKITTLLIAAKIQRRVQETLRELKLQGSRHHQTSGNERKNSTGVSQEKKKLIETRLYRRNLIKRINTWVVSLVRYSRSFLKWTREEFKQMNQRTRKLMTIHKAQKWHW